MVMQSGRSIEMLVAADLIRIFYPLLQVGVKVEVEVGCSVRKLLMEQFGIAADFITKRITTLFLNSKAIDDSSTALVNDGAVLALSGAMPGLVGATMRSGGYYAAMRSSISFQSEGVPAAKRGTIKVKLFNLLLDELGPRILMRGIKLSGAQLKEFLNTQPNLRLRKCCVDGQFFRGDFNTLVQAITNDDEIINFRVQFGD
jgi:hypothetical protein